MMDKKLSPFNAFLLYVIVVSVALTLVYTWDTMVNWILPLLQ